jgi:hypothetical protein
LPTPVSSLIAIRLPLADQIDCAWAPERCSISAQAAQPAVLIIAGFIDDVTVVDWGGRPLAV